MARVALITAPGCEEGETLTIADVLRRAEISCDMVGLDGLEVAGTHHITMRCDTVFDGSLGGYDMVVLPGRLSQKSDLVQNIFAGKSVRIM